MPSAQGRPYREIIVGHDGSDGADDALALAALLRSATGADLVVAHVLAYDAFLEGLEDLGGEPARLRDEYLETEGAKAARQVGEIAARAGAKLEMLASVSPARGLHDLATQRGADLLVIGSSGRGALGRVFAGSVGERLLHGSPCAIAVAPREFRDHDDPALRVIGVGYDASPEAEVALRRAAALAQAVGAALRLLAVLRRLPPTPGSTGLEAARRAHARERLDRALGTVPEGIARTGELLVGEPVPTLAEQNGLDLLVVGSRGYGPLRQVLLGGVSRRLIHEARYPVLVLPRGAAGSPSGGPP